MTYYLYILTNKHHTVFYTGITNNITKRVFEHKNKSVTGLTQKYNINKLVFLENFSNINDALEVEKKVKKWKRE